MKTRCTILLLCLSMAMKAQQLTSLEYFYDTDPGFGNGTQLTLNNAVSLDSVFNFPVNGLTQGVHTIFIRLKNSDNNWSHTIYEGNFFVWTGSSGTAQIQMLNYFIDSTSNSISLPLNLSASLDTTISINIPDNGANVRKLGLRIKNQTGQLGNATLANINLCNLYSPFSEFRSARFGNSYTFIDQSLFNVSNKIKWLINNIADTTYNDARVFNYTLPAGFIGTKTIKQITGTGCRVDTAIFQVIGQGIESISPQTGYFGQDIVLNVFGGDLDSTTQLTLMHGSTNVTPYNKASYLNKMFTAIFDFHNISGSSPGVQSDYYDLHVHFSNGYDTTIANAVLVGTFAAINGCNADPGLPLITDHRPPCNKLRANDGSFITANLSGAQNIKAGVWNYYTMNLTNTGYALAKEFPFWILIPAHYDVNFNLNYVIPHPFGDSLSIDSLPTVYFPIDTVLNGHHYQYKAYGLYISYLSPGETRSIDFQLRTTDAIHDQILYWPQRPMFGSPFYIPWLDCLWDAAGYVPGVSCVTGVCDFIGNNGGFDGSYKSDLSHGHLYEAFHAAGTLGWNLTSVGITCGGGTIAAKEFKAATAVIQRTENIENKLDKTLTTLSNNGANGCSILDYTTEFEANLWSFLGFDPNNLTGNNDYDSIQHFINNYSPQHYTVNFENKPTANGKVQHVYVTDTLNPDKFDFHTFSFTGYRIADSSFMVPQFRKQVFQVTGIRHRNDMKVEFSGSFDTLTGIVRADFISMDSAGNRAIPDTSLDGFLPPNGADSVSGTGNFQFQVSAKNLNTLDTFRNVATIYFDNNTPINTNEWMNTVDTTAPTGHISGAYRVNDTTYKLVIQHADIGSGFNSNFLFSKSSTDSLFRNVGKSSQDTINFIGRVNETYQLFSKAIDNVGNEQVKDSVADIIISFSNPLPLSWLSFTGKMIGEKVQLTWITANEMNTSHFDVEKSADGIHFSKIGNVTALGNTHQNNEYIFFDEHPFTGNNYYRLKQFDNDGKTAYSTVVKIYYGTNGFVIIAPNPAKDFVEVRSSEMLTQIQLIDMNGKLVKTFVPSASNIYSLTDISRGMYLLRLFSDREIQTHKLMIAK